MQTSHNTLLAKDCLLHLSQEGMPNLTEHLAQQARAQKGSAMQAHGMPGSHTVSTYQPSSSKAGEAEMQGHDDADDGAADEEEPETLPLLARRVMAGRQSIAPQPTKVMRRADGSVPSTPKM